MSAREYQLHYEYRDGVRYAVGATQYVYPRHTEQKHEFEARVEEIARFAGMSAQHARVFVTMDCGGNRTLVRAVIRVEYEAQLAPIMVVVPSHHETQPPLSPAPRPRGKRGGRALKQAG